MKIIILLLVAFAPSFFFAQTSTFDPYVTPRSGTKVDYTTVKVNNKVTKVDAVNSEGSESYKFDEINSMLSDYRANKYDEIPYMQWVVFNNKEQIKFEKDSEGREYKKFERNSGDQSGKVYFASENATLIVTDVVMHAGTINGAEHFPSFVLLVDDRSYVLFRGKSKEMKQKSLDLVQEAFSREDLTEMLKSFSNLKEVEFKKYLTLQAKIRAYYMNEHYIVF